MRRRVRGMQHSAPLHISVSLTTLAACHKPNSGMGALTTGAQRGDGEFKANEILLSSAMHLEERSGALKDMENKPNEV